MLQMEQQMKVLVVEPTFIVNTFAIIVNVDLDQIVHIAIAAAVVHIIVVNNIAITCFVDFNH